MASTNIEESLNIVIPMGGIGSRFTKEQYRFPKPLVRICGREMLLWLLDHLTIKTDDIIWLAMSPELDEQFLITNRFRKEYPQFTIRTVHLQFQTMGSAETLYSLLQEMNAGELSRRTISLDCDTIYFTDILSPLRNLPAGEGASFYFEDTSGRPIFSFLKMNEDNQIEDIREKVKISNKANTGAYAFASGKLMKEACAARLDMDVGTLGEYYTSSVIKTMITDGHVFRGVHVEDFVCVGTPRQLQAFLRSIRDKDLDHATFKTKTVEEIVGKARRRFCFDLDGTLVTFPVVPRDYTTCRPIESNIKLAQELHEAGHTIIIHTARRMATHGGNVAAVIADIGKVTIEQLDNFNIPYDELVFGKPHAHVHIDDNAINAQMNTFKEIGWMRSEQIDGGHDGYWEKKTMVAEPQSEMVDPRSFNTVMAVGNAIFKSGPKLLIQGEKYFYENVPEALQEHFPKLLPGMETPEGFEDVLSLHVELIPGTTFSQIMLGKCLTRGRFEAALKVLKALHTFDGEADVDIESSLFYENYGPKVEGRYNKYSHVYKKLPEAARVYEKVMAHLKDYTENDRVYRAKCIHGDPVFTNILLTKTNGIKMIDMRGSLGDVMTMQGDAVYDLGKVYQTITGYDFLLHNECITEQDRVYCEELQEVFWSFVKENYPSIRSDDIKMIAGSLYFSLIPLHDKSKRPIFFEQCCKVVDSM